MIKTMRKQVLSSAVFFAVCVVLQLAVDRKLELRHTVVMTVAYFIILSCMQYALAHHRKKTEK